MLSSANARARASYSRLEMLARHAQGAVGANARARASYSRRSDWSRISSTRSRVNARARASYSRLETPQNPGLGDDVSMPARGPRTRDWGTSQAEQGGKGCQCPREGLVLATSSVGSWLPRRSACQCPREGLVLATAQVMTSLPAPAATGGNARARGPRTRDARSTMRTRAPSLSGGNARARALYSRPDRCRGCRSNDNAGGNARARALYSRLARAELLRRQLGHGNATGPRISRRPVVDHQPARRGAHGNARARALCSRPMTRCGMECSQVWWQCPREGLVLATQRRYARRPPKVAMPARGPRTRDLPVESQPAPRMVMPARGPCTRDWHYARTSGSGGS